MPLLSWIDHDRGDADRVKRVLALFNKPEARDELGIGAIRDTVSDLLFPGTSTIQTHVAYMLFAPWLYGQLERNASSDRLARDLRQREGQLIDALREAHGSSEAGIIGIEAGDKIQRLSSEIYWAGLKAWGIRSFAGSQKAFHDARRYLPGAGRGFDENLPSAPPDFPRRASLKLRKCDKEYLRHRIACLPAHRAQEPFLTLLIESEGKKVDAPWEHPAACDAPASIRGLLHHAQTFATVMYGAVLLYHALLARRCQFKDVGWYDEAFRTWAGGQKKGAEFSAAELKHWRLEEFKAQAVHESHRINPKAWQFVEAWLVLVRSKGDDLLTDAAAAGLIERRESDLKDKRARLSNPEARSTWRGAPDTTPLNYRWSIVRRYLEELKPHP